jgi:hypothetical protein
VLMRFGSEINFIGASYSEMVSSFTSMILLEGRFEEEVAGFEEEFVAVLASLFFDKINGLTQSCDGKI